MALTTAQQTLFSEAAFRWLQDQHAAGNTRAEYQLWKATAAQVKAALLPYLDAIKTERQADQARAATIRAAQDAEWQATIDTVNAIEADPTP